LPRSRALDPCLATSNERPARVPSDSAAVSNTVLRQSLSQALGRDVEEYEYATARDQLIAQGLLVKVKGRGGSVRRAQRDAEDFALAAHEVRDAESPVPTAKARKPKSAKAAKS
jgi:hypothetical protein